MVTSWSSRRTSSISRTRSREEPEVTLDDVAAVVAGLNAKVVQLRREIRALRESPRSRETDGRVGRRNAESRRSKLAAGKGRGTKSEDNNEYFGAPERYWFEDISRQKVGKNPLDQRNRRKNFISAVYRGESSISDETTKGRSTSVSSGRDRRRTLKNHTTQTFELPKNTKLSSRNRAREVSVNSEIVRNHEVENRKPREPAKNGAKTDGNKVRSVRRKRISRGVQVELRDTKKSSSFRGCFAWKCCVAKNNKVDKTSVENSKEKQYNSESSDAYKPRVIVKGEKNVKKRHPEKNRISGGGERLTSEQFKKSLIRPPPRVANVNEPQRHSGRRRRNDQAMETEDRWIQNNEAADVKRRLNECLIELNGIIGDVGYLFGENMTNS